MPPTGFHGIIGLFFSRFTRSPSLKTGIVFGSVIPDVDLLGSALVYIITGSEDLTIAFHRTLTHSVITIIAMFILAFLFERRGSLAEFSNLNYPKLLLGTATGMMIHVCIDFFYLDGVSFLAPLYWERITIIDFSYEHITLFSQKILAAADFQFEAFFWMILWYLATKKECCNHFRLCIAGKRIEIKNVRDKLLWLSIAEAVLMLGFLLFAYTPITRNSFIILLYIPGVFILLVSAFSPLVFRGIFIDERTNEIKL